MKRKLKIALHFLSQAVKRMIIAESRKDFYNGRTLNATVMYFAKYLSKNGVRATKSMLKKEVLRVTNASGKGLHLFPNGVVSGVDIREVKKWPFERPVSIVIPSYNDYDLLKVCVESIHRTAEDAVYEVVVVDDYAKEENRIKLRTLEDEFTRVVYREQNGGFAIAVNDGLRNANPSYDVVLLNSDIEAHDGWLRALQYGAYEFDKTIGIIGPKLLYPDGRIQSAGSYRNTEDTEWFDHYYRFQDEDYGPANVPQYTLAMTGAALYIKREVIDSIGILDDKFEFAFEDVDYCLRAWEAGYKVAYFPASVLTHFESATRSKNKNISAKEKSAVVYFWKKWDAWFNERNVRDENGRIKIIYVLQTVGRSGGIKIVIEHVNRLAKLGFVTELWSLDSSEPAWPVEVPMRSFKNYRQLVDALAEEEAIKVATWWETARPVWLASLRKGVAVNFIQEIESWFYPNDADAQRSVISCYRKEFINMTTSSYNEDEIRQLGLKAARIPCGYEDDIYYPKANVQKINDTLLAVGRTFFQKNFNFTFRAWRLLGDRRPQMWLFGSEPDMKSMDERITYFDRPTDDELNDLYNKSSMFVQTSRHEGFCLPLLEAMAAGTPVICTDAHGNRDFCIDEKTCLMVRQDDDSQLKSAIERLQLHPELREKLQKNALRMARNFTWGKVTEQLASFYEEVAAPKKISKKVARKYGK